MNIFEIINIVAVAGTTLLMMAISTVWYSSMLFGSVWAKSAGVSQDAAEHDKSNVVRTLVFTFVGYFIALSILAYVVTLSPLLSVIPLVAALFVTIFALALSAGPVISEGKSLSYYLINGGFMTVFIMGGTLVLQYWPW